MSCGPLWGFKIGALGYSGDSKWRCSLQRAFKIVVVGYSEEIKSLLLDIARILKHSFF
jgi:hypothetical protein